MAEGVFQGRIHARGGEGHAQIDQGPLAPPLDDLLAQIIGLREVPRQDGSGEGVTQARGLAHGRLIAAQDGAHHFGRHTALERHVDADLGAGTAVLGQGSHDPRRRQGRARTAAAAAEGGHQGEPHERPGSDGEDVAHVACVVVPGPLHGGDDAGQDGAQHRP
jgi:hypothetical protein